MDRPTPDNPLPWDELTNELKNEIREEYSWVSDEILEGRSWAHVPNNWLYWTTQ